MTPIRTARATLAFACVALASTACYDEPNISDIPRISFQDVSVENQLQSNGQYARQDSLFLTIRFQDGDGDLGTDDPQNGEFGFLFESVERKVGEDFENVDITGSVPLGGRLPVGLGLGNEGSPVEGQLTYSFALRVGLTGTSEDLFDVGDSVRFSVFVKDRADNYSNTVTTSVVRLGPE